MTGVYENPSEYCTIVKSLLLYEIWSKLSESYNVILSKNTNLERCIFEKSIKKYEYLILLYMYAHVHQYIASLGIKDYKYSLFIIFMFKSLS